MVQLPPMRDMPLLRKRAVCPHCLRAQRTCICSLAVPVRHVTEILILQHPLEVREAKGTARLLHQCLSRSRLVVGERFDAEVLHSLLYDRWPTTQETSQEGARAQPILLYPPTPGCTLHEEAAGQGTPDDARRYRLVMLDGTWRKSRKMLHQNPLLAGLPRLGLEGKGASRYHIRKAQGPDQLSTLEAAYYALTQLEAGAEQFQPLLDAFAEFMARHVRHASAGLDAPGEPD